MLYEHEHHSSTRLQSTAWIINARWGYALLAFFLGFIAGDLNSTPNAALILYLSLFFVLATNLFYFFYLKKINSTIDPAGGLNMLNASQITIDLIFFFIIALFAGGGVGSTANSFFFIPIMVSMILFGFQGAIAVAIVSGCLLMLSVLVYEGVLTALFSPHLHAVITPEVSLSLMKAGIIFMVYLLVGFFGGYISRLINARDLLLLEQIKKEEGHVRRLETLTEEFDKSAKLLVRRDLDLSNANQKLTQLDKMKSEIISIVAHQLRTPLSAIKWTLKILLDEDVGPVAPAQRELLSKGFESNERMIALINDMLAVDRLESGKLKYSFVPVQFEELVQEMIRSLLPLASEKNIRIELSIPEVQLPKIKIDPDKMHDVLQNLIDNAIKYTKQGGLITVGVTRQGEDLHFWVKDNGIGIPDSEKEKIFARFFRAENAIHSETNGSGLGLFIAQSIVIRHAGKIWFDSVLNEGTTFHVLLPFSP